MVKPLFLNNPIKKLFDSKHISKNVIVCDKSEETMARLALMTVAILSKEWVTRPTRASGIALRPL